MVAINFPLNCRKAKSIFDGNTIYKQLKFEIKSKKYLNNGQC